MANVIVPSLADVTPSHAGLAGFSHWTKNYVLDRPIVDFCSFQPHNITATGLAGVGAGAPVFTEINSSDIVSLHMDTSADSFSVLWRLPQDIDLNKDLDFRLFYSAPAAIVAANTSLFTFTYKILDSGVTTVAAAATAMDSDAAAQLSFGLNIAGNTGWNTISGPKLESYEPGVDRLIIKVVLTLATLASVDVFAGEARYWKLFA